MKNNIIKKSLLVIMAFMFQTIDVLAKKQLPAPTGAGGFDDGVVVGGPIDDYLPLLFLAALIFGVWITLKRQKLILVK